MDKLRAVVDWLCDKQGPHPHEFDLRTLLDGHPTQLVGYKLIVGKDTLSIKAPYGPNAPKHQIDLEELKNKVDQINEMAFPPSGYRQVKQDPLFQQLYDVKLRSLKYSTPPEDRLELSIPCMLCGFIQPLQNISIDHQRPQRNGENEAIIKTFRILELTFEGPQGKKGKQLMEHFASKRKGQVPKALEAVRPRAGRALLAGVDRFSRYSLKLEGAALYTIFHEASSPTGATTMPPGVPQGSSPLKELQAACLHGLVNLRPACNHCNSSRGATLKCSLPAGRSVTLSAFYSPTALPIPFAPSVAATTRSKAKISHHPYARGRASRK